MATYTGNPGNVDDNLIGTVDDDMFYGQDNLELVERALQKPFKK